MRTASAKAKGRRLQVLVAEKVARAFNLTIEAALPTKPGLRNGVVWVPEGESPDLRVRAMGQPGADVALLSARARARVCLNGRPLWIECKCQEAGWSFDAKFWDAGTPQLRKFVFRAFVQARRSPVVRTGGMMPLIVLSRNRHPPIAVWEGRSPLGMRVFRYVQSGEYTFALLDSFLEICEAYGPSTS